VKPHLVGTLTISNAVEVAKRLIMQLESAGAGRATLKVTERGAFLDGYYGAGPWETRDSGGAAQTAKLRSTSASD